MGFLSIFDILIFLKLIIFNSEICPPPQQTGGEKGSFTNCMLPARGNLLSASIRHSIYFKAYSAMYGISELPPSNLN